MLVPNPTTANFSDVSLASYMEKKKKKLSYHTKKSENEVSRIARNRVKTDYRITRNKSQNRLSRGPKSIKVVCVKLTKDEGHGDKSTLLSFDDIAVFALHILHVLTHSLSSCGVHETLATIYRL